MERERDINEEFADRCKRDFVQDGEKLTICCSNCKAPLVEIWKTRPYVQVSTNLDAVCGLCNDKSFIHRVRGGFHMASIENGKVVIIDTQTGDSNTDTNDNIIQRLTIITTKKV